MGVAQGVQEPAPPVGQLHGVEDLETPVGPHGDADLEECAGQPVRAADEQVTFLGRPPTRCLLIGW